MRQQGALIDVVMTRSATKFVTPLTFGAITHRPVSVDPFDPQTEFGIDHVAVAERADVVVVAPATANTLAKLAWGMADDALSATVLATRAPVIAAPAMDANMYQSPATRENVAKLEARGFVIAGPAEGRLASGLMGHGRLLETAELLGYLGMVLGRDGDLAERKVVVSAGGTQEPVDPVRVVTNRSSGKMGYAIAEAARDRGARTVLVSAPTSLAEPVGVEVTRTETALEMRRAVLDASADADALIMAAAVADWRPVEPSSKKLKKGDEPTWTIELTKNPDILSEATSGNIIKVGFAAESDDLLGNAQSKLVSKGLHLIAANDISADEGGFASDDNRVLLLDREGDVEELPLMPKYEVGHRILDRVAALLG